MAKPITNRKNLTVKERKTQEEEIKVKWIDSKVKLIKALELKHTTLDDLDKVLEAIKVLPEVLESLSY